MFLMLLVLTTWVTPCTLTIQDGTDRYVGDSVLHIWNHTPDDLKVGGQVRHRIDGHHLFVKRADGKN